MGVATIMDKRPWDSNAVFIFFCHFWVSSWNSASLACEQALGFGKGWKKITFILPSSTLDRRPVHRLCILFEIVLQFSLPTLFKVETWKKFWIYVSNFVCGLRGGFGSCVNWKTPQKCKSVPRLLSIILVPNPRLSNHSDLVGILPIMLENPESWSVFYRDRKNPDCNICCYK